MPNALSPGERADRYIVLELVGEGGFGRVYRAEHATVGRIVALKELFEERIAPADLPAAVADFEREARTLCRLTESDEVRRFIPQVFDHFEHEGRRFLAMEFVQGRTLEQVLEEAGQPLPWRQVVEWAIQVCDALELFHSQDPPLILRDIKPSNLMLCDRDGRIRIIDFGIAKQLRPGASASTRWLGSPGYAAPEQMVGHPAPSSDIYSLGATMYRLVTNRQPRGESGSPFDMPSASEVTRELGAEAVPEGLSDLIGRCVRLEMSGRFASAGELRAALERELGRTGDFGTKPHAVPVKESAPQAPPGAAVRRQRVWLKSLWARGALVLAVIACGLLVLWGVAGGPAPPANPVEGQVWVNPKDGSEMVWIPAGGFIMGSDDGYEDEKPRRRVFLSGYWIGKCEVTRGKYRQFMDAGGYSNPAYWSSDGWNWKEAEGRTEPDYWAADQDWGSVLLGGPQPFTQTESHPVVGVSYYEAEAYCAWAGGHLPTEAQWAKAARGTDGRTYPWGNEWVKWVEEKCNNYNDTNPAGGGSHRQQTAPVGSYPAGASPYGCHDMAGNVWEWCRDWYSDSYYSVSPSSDPPGPSSGSDRVLRGGAWNDYGYSCAGRDRHADPNHGGNVLGFRLAR